MAVLDHEEVSEMLATYSLGRVTTQEAALVEQHLVDCPRCRAELAELRECGGAVAAARPPAPRGAVGPDRLGTDRAGGRATGGSPVAADRFGPEGGPGESPPPASPLSSSPCWGSSATGWSTSTTASAAPVRPRPARRQPAGHPRSGRPGAPHYSSQPKLHHARRCGGAARWPAYWVDDDLSTLPPGRTYQLWALSSGKVVSLAAC